MSTAAAFIKSNMPRGWGWTLSDDDAFDVAAYVNAQPRPDFPGKATERPRNLRIHIEWSCTSIQAMKRSNGGR